MTSGAFRSQFYSKDILNRKIRIEDLRVELASEYDALSTAQSMEDVYRLQGSIDILKQLIDVLEKGATAPSPDDGTSETP